MRRSFTGVAGLGLLAIFSTAKAEPLADTEISLNLRASCEDVTTEAGVRDCQQAFMYAAENIIEREKMLLGKTTIIMVGRQKDPEDAHIPYSSILSRSQMMSAVNNACSNLVFKKPRDENAGRLDDGTRTGLYRIAVRAKTCAAMTGYAGAVMGVTVPTPLLMNLDANASDVIMRTGSFALAY